MFPSTSLDIVLAVIGGTIAVPSALAQDKDPASAPPVQTEAAAEPPADATPHTPAGLVPLIDYKGDLWTRPRLLGDLGGTRTDLANKGLQFDINFTQTLQSVVDGGLDTDTRYGGTLDYNAIFDLHRMGVLPGAIVKFRGESKYGETVNHITGQILPANSDGFFPFTHTADEDIPFTVTNLAYMQFLSENIGFLIGKFDTIDADPNEFVTCPPNPDPAPMRVPRAADLDPIFGPGRMRAEGFNRPG